jgi:hypothetical protein
MHSLKDAKKTASYVVKNKVGVMNNKNILLTKKQLKKLEINN